MAKILIVDDSQQEREMMASMLTHGGHTDVETAPSAESALRRIERGDIDLVVTDFVMPGLDGLQLANRAIELSPRLKDRILIVTGGMFGREDALAFAMRTTVITKPFSIETLLRTVQSLLEGQLRQGA